MNVIFFGFSKAWQYQATLLIMPIESVSLNPVRSYVNKGTVRDIAILVLFHLMFAGKVAQLKGAQLVLTHGVHATKSEFIEKGARVGCQELRDLSTEIVCFHQG